jgi:Cd2+/Zn2+-exporting ATPase
MAHESGKTCSCGKSCECGEIEEREENHDTAKEKWLVIAGAALLILAWVLPLHGTARLIAFLVPYLVVGWDVLREAAEKLLHGAMLEEDFLMAVASIGAFCIGEYPEAVAVMLFYRVGELFEDYAVGSSRRSIAALMDIRPDYANIEENGEIRRVDPNDVKPGDVIVVKPGEKIPLDGIVAEGSTTVDTAALTGESMPRTAGVGEKVISGCINLTGLIKVTVTSAFGESTVAKILELVENSSKNKSRSEDFITRFARIYTPAVVGCAVALAIIPSIITGAWSSWINRALVFLVVSCPCALVVSVPLSFFGGIGGASRCGILIKGSNYLETLSKADTIAFDKTGTVTEGRFSVTQVCTAGTMDKGEIVSLAAMAECFSNHPIALSLKNAVPELPDPDSVTGVEEIPGRGVKAVIGGRTVLAGNAALMRENGVEPSRDVHEGAIVHVAADGVYAGHIVVADKIKEGSGEAIKALKSMGISRTVMLTGDLKNVGEAVGAELGVDEVKSELLPGDKVSAVEALLKEKKEGAALAFVGDGVNDAPVLARADVGVAMGAMGSDAAIEAADIVLMDDDLRSLPLAISISRRTMMIAKENIVFALTVKFAILVLGALGIAGMWLAVFGDVGVLILAVLNATRALKIKR